MDLANSTMSSIDWGDTIFNRSIVQLSGLKSTQAAIRYTTNVWCICKPTVIVLVVAGACFQQRLVDRAVLYRRPTVPHLIKEMNVFLSQKHGSSYRSHWTITPSIPCKPQVSNRYANKVYMHTLTSHKKTRLQDRDSGRRTCILLISKMPCLQFQNLTTCSKSCTLFLLSSAKAWC